jgi:galactokinase
MGGSVLRVLPSFEDLFGIAPQVSTDAPGRVNLIGEHTDYNGGFVLPAAIPQRTRVQVAARADRTVRLWSAQFPDDEPHAFTLGDEKPTGGWVDYIMGLTRQLAAFPVRGFDARIASDVPVGSGLSSSAALEIAAGRALRTLFALPLDDVALARMGQRAEHDFVGAPVGIMDQMACSLADTTAALFLDTRTLAYERVPLPPQAALVVIDSGLAHAHSSGDYRVRREECAEAARRLGVPELRDLADAAPLERLPPPLDRRARHVFTENARVLETVAALRGGDSTRAGKLFEASHASMRDDFEISVGPIDILVQIASSVQGVYGARLTGGGFGGSIVALVDASGARSIADRIVGAYHRQTGNEGRRLVPE